MQVTAGHFPLERAGKAFFGKMANQAADIRHFLNVQVIFRKNFLRAMAGRAVPGLRAGKPDNLGWSCFLRPLSLGKASLSVQAKKENHQSGKQY